MLSSCTMGNVGSRISQPLVLRFRLFFFLNVSPNFIVLYLHFEVNVGSKSSVELVLVANLWRLIGEHLLWHHWFGFWPQVKHAKGFSFQEHLSSSYLLWVKLYFHFTWLNGFNTLKLKIDCFICFAWTAMVTVFDWKVTGLMSLTECMWENLHLRTHFNFLW